MYGRDVGGDIHIEIDIEIDLAAAAADDSIFKI